MTLEELSKLIHSDLRELGMTPNTVEYASKYKEATKAAYALDDFPVLAGLEYTWKLIEEDFPLLGEERENDNYQSPVSRFIYNVDTGFYPPPEIMLSLLQCFQLYYAYGGRKSLDEIFFGKPHTKKSSPAFTESQSLKYRAFALFYATGDMDISTGDNTLKGKSLVERAEAFLETRIYEKAETDPETFLKGYRRWCKRNGNISFGTEN